MTGETAVHRNSSRNRICKSGANLPRLASPLLYEVLPPEAKHTQNPYTTQGLAVFFEKSPGQKARAFAFSYIK
ncbi:hypothetical protein B4100_0676 [Heyndrickxia coagulans]|nr:hypothetical protein B4100_0676 [Heyndrickxia coagulans]